MPLGGLHHSQAFRSFICSLAYSSFFVLRDGNSRRICKEELDAMTYTFFMFDFGVSQLHFIYLERRM